MIIKTQFLGFKNRLSSIEVAHMQEKCWDLSFAITKTNNIKMNKTLDTCMADNL